MTMLNMEAWLSFQNYNWRQSYEMHVIRPIYTNYFLFAVGFSLDWTVWNKLNKEIWNKLTFFFP